MTSSAVRSSADLQPDLRGVRATIVGYGLLGRAIADRLTMCGCQLRVSDPRSDLHAATAGTEHEPCPTEAAFDQTDTVIVAVFSSEQVMDVLESLSRQQSSGPEHATLIVATTLTPAQANQLSRRSRELGFALVEFPVSGTSSQIRNGAGLGLAAVQGPITALTHALLRAITPAVEYCDEIGTPAKTKLAINLVLEINRTALAHGIALADTLGLDLDVYLDVLQRSAASSAVAEAKGPKMLRRDFAPEGRAAQSLKDCNLIAAHATGPLPMLDAQRAMLKTLVGRGDGDLDGAAVIELLRPSTTAGRASP